MLDLPTVAFYVIAVVMVGSALAVVLLRNIVHAALFLALFFGAAAGVYVLLNAEFIAIVQMLIYAGAVTVLVLFAIMLTQNAMTRTAIPSAGQWWLAGLICVVLARRYHLRRGRQPDGDCLGGRLGQSGLRGRGRAAPSFGSGNLLYSPFDYSYVLPFEIASIVLLVAIVGAIVIGRED